MVVQITLLAVDIDGTLLDGRGRIPDANRAAIVAAVDRGVKVVIATGRSFGFALQALDGLPDTITLIVHNGAIARERGGRTLLRRLLPRRVALGVVEATRAWRADTTAVFDRPDGRQLVYDRMDWSRPGRRSFREANRDMLHEVARLEDALVEDDPVQIAFNGQVAGMRAVAAHLAASPVAGDLQVALTEYPRRDFSMVDVCAAGVTKGTGLAEVARLLDVPRAAVMAVGDNHNDRDMLEWAGVGVVMGNAEPELLDAGFHRTGTNDAAGLAEAIHRFVLVPR